ncbi:C4-dicarboxylate ABC transporter permease [Desulfosarcina widdelii]|uniref:C4-dicarboxylate ABC transporter permease n=1 Tax=Desulfosarcina widdelii TaxID=947919 RepID=A0A5K7ZCN2_9BACT|nr:TRAP transporter large permease [Desulfosarcina widdelii]BBO78580.1 C4-dicarboxylate ABC transporter permease [Desulfosarcina widdelii]
MGPIEISIIGICGLLILLAIRVPIAFALCIAGIVGIMALDGWTVGIFSLGNYPFAFLKSWLLVAVPLFILMGYLASSAGVTTHAFTTAYRWLGELPGGLAMASIAACAAFAATSGSSVATAGMLGAVAIPEMQKYGYDRKLASASVAAGGLLGILIPPSIVLVIYGFITRTSVAKLLLAGILPGILTALTYFVGIYLMVKYRPSIAPKAMKFTWTERIRSLPKMWGVFVLFLAVVIGIYAGIFTPTEAAAVGTFIAFLMSLLKNFRSPVNIIKAFADTGRTTGMILAICVGASLFTQFITLSGLPDLVAEKVASIQVAPIWIMLTMLAIYLPLGLFLDTISMLLITVPIFFPIVVSLGYDPIVFGILVVKMEEISLITPPVGLNVYVIKGVAPEIPLSDIFIGIVPFLIMEFVVMAILIAFPEVVMFLPNSMIAN